MKKIIILIVVMLVLCGCEKEECEEYKEVDSVCSSMMCIPSGQSIVCVPTSRICKQRVCIDKDSDKE